MRGIEAADDEDNDVFDENGLLLDGKRWRVPLRMMDSLQRAVGGHSNAETDDISGRVLHRPGFATDARSVAERYRIYDQYDAEISAAYKNPPTGVGSHGSIGPQEGDPCTCRGPEFPDDIGSPGRMQNKNGRMVCVPVHRSGSRDGTTDAKQAAYAEYEAYIANAWRGAGQ